MREVKVVVGFLCNVEDGLDDAELQKRFNARAMDFVPRSPEIKIKQKAVLIKPKVVGSSDKKPVEAKSPSTT